jgi:hypothetical protein
MSNTLDPAIKALASNLEALLSLAEKERKCLQLECHYGSWSSTFKTYNGYGFSSDLNAALSGLFLQETQPKKQVATSYDPVILAEILDKAFAHEYWGNCRFTFVADFRKEKGNVFKAEFFYSPGALSGQAYVHGKKLANDAELALATALGQAGVL